MKTIVDIEWMCRYCGKRVRRPVRMGRPDPGQCPRRKGDMPHSWLKNRTFEKNN